MTPWMHISEIQLIEKYLSPDTIMLEWGSGGSTLYFSSLVKKYYSIEHDQKWFNKLVQKNIPDNTYMYIVPPDIEVPPPESTHEAYRGYIEKAGTFKTKFDAVLIDGRARLACAIYIKKHLHQNSFVFIHDFWKKRRTRYRPVFDHYKEIESITDTLQTIIVLKPKL